MAVLTVGPSGQFTSITAAVAAAQSGDTIEVAAGTYTNDFPQGITKNLTLQGVGGMVHMVAMESPPNGKAILDVGAPGVTVTINDFEFSGTTVADGNGAGIRYEAGNLVLNNDYFHNNQDGLLSAADPSGSITINHCEFANNGAGDGYTHNLYVGEVGTLTVENSYFTGAVVGHEIKSRALNNIHHRQPHPGRADRHRQLRHRSAERRQRADPGQHDREGPQRAESRTSSPMARRVASMQAPASPCRTTSS